MSDQINSQAPKPAGAAPAQSPSGAGRIGGLTTGRLPALTPERRRVRLPRLPRTGLFAYIAVMVPGLISASAGNDAGGVATYASAGAVYRYATLWALLLTTISLIVVQEMCARMGAVTGKGLSDLIREQFSLRATTLAMACLLIANMGITVSEYLGLAASGKIFNIPPWIFVPALALVLWFLVTQQGSGIIDKVFLGLTLIFLVYIPAAFHGTHWHTVLHDVVQPPIQGSTGAYIGVVVALIGTTISPYMQFFVQSSVAEKGASMREYPYTRAGVLSGSIFAIAVAAFIVIATGTALCTDSGCPPANANISDAVAFAKALQSVVGNSAEALFAIGLFGASMLAAGVLPLSTAFAICETFGLESGTEKNFTQAPVFNGIFTGMIIVSTIIAIIPNLPIVPVLVNLQILNAVMLPILLVFIVRLVNDTTIMGEYRNNRLFNMIAYATVVVLSALSVLYLLGQVGIGPAAV